MRCRFPRLARSSPHYICSRWRLHSPLENEHSRSRLNTVGGRQRFCTIQLHTQRKRRHRARYTPPHICNPLLRRCQQATPSLVGSLSTCRCRCRSCTVLAGTLDNRPHQAPNTPSYTCSRQRCRWRLANPSCLGRTSMCWRKLLPLPWSRFPPRTQCKALPRSHLCIFPAHSSHTLVHLGL